MNYTCKRAAPAAAAVTSFFRFRCALTLQPASNISVVI